MASKRNWIAFILYISFYMPQSFSTTLEPSSESSYLTSFSTGSTNNASDITNTSILSQLTSPSPEAPTGVQETSHISEELNTQFSTRTTVLLDHEDLNRDEHPGIRSSVNTASSLDGDTNSNMTPEEISTTELPVSNKRHRLPYTQPKHTVKSEEKLPYAKSSYTKKKVMSKNQHNLSKSAPSSISDLVARNEKSESLEHNWGNESDANNQTETGDLSHSGVVAVSEISQALDETPNFRRKEHNAAPRKEGLNPRTEDMPFQPVTSQEPENKTVVSQEPENKTVVSQEPESKTVVNSNAMKVSVQDSYFKSGIDNRPPENGQEMKTESSESYLLQNNDVKRNDSSEIAADSSVSEEHLDYNANSTHSLSSDNLLNSSAYNDVSTSPGEDFSERPHTNSSQSRKRRSSDHSPTSFTELPETYLTASSSDASSDAAQPTDTPSTENLVHPTSTKFENTNGSVFHVIDSVALSAVKGTLSQSNLSDTSYVTTLSSTTLTSVNEDPTLNSTSQMLNAVASEAKEVSDPGSSLASSVEGVTVMSEAYAADKFDGQGISGISGMDSVTVSTKVFTQKVHVAEDTVASTMPLCKDDDEIYVESTSEISIKVFPLCEKQEVSKAVISGSSSEGSIFGTPTSSFIQNLSAEIQNNAVNRSQSTSEDADDSAKITEPVHEGSEAEEHSENITVGYKSSGMTESATDTGAFQDADSENSEQANFPESVSGKTPSEDLTVSQNELETKATEASDAINTEIHSNPSDLMEIEFTEVSEKPGQSKDIQAVTALPEVVRNLEDYENPNLDVHTVEQVFSNKTDRNSPIIKPALHKSPKEIVINSSSSSFDYVADQSEVLPVMAYPPSQNISFIEDFTARKEVKITDDTVSTDISVVYPVGNITGFSGNSETHQDNESVAADITALENPVSPKTQNLSSVSLAEMVNHTISVNSDGSGNQEANTRKSENSTSMETKIAGVGVKTTVSVSLNVTKANSTIKDKPSRDSFQDMNPVVTFINLTSINQKLPSDFMKKESEINQNVTDSSESPEGTPVGSPNRISADPSKPPEGTQSPLPQPSTTKRSFSIRKPRLRLNGDNSGGPVSRKPFFVKTPPTRASEIIAPVSIFQKNRTRLGSITSSTTPSTTVRVSWKPFVGQPMTWRYGLENFTFAPEVETVPTTTEEEVQDSDTETVSFSTLSQHDTVRYRVPGSIVVRRGINCLPNHFKNKHSSEYRTRARKVTQMLRSLFAGTEISHTVLNVEIEGIGCRKSGNITVDYNLYLSKGGSDVKTHELVKIFNSRLVNSTFNQWVLDPSATTFDERLEEAVNTPAPSTEDVEPPIPQWAIAVIVIGAASLVFIILFGALTVYGRHHMRRRYNGSRLGDDDVDRAIDSREWDDKMAATYENLAADGIYDIDDGGFDSVKRGPYGHARHSKVSRHDSWKSDWTERPRRSRYPNDF